jgi:hypothetical protein
VAVLSCVLLFPTSSPIFGKLPKEVWAKGGAYTRSWWGNLREREHLKDPDDDGRIIVRSIFRK